MADLSQLGIDTEALTEDEKLWGALANIPIFALLALFVLEDKKFNPFVRFNAIQGLGLTVMLVLASVVSCGAASPVLFIQFFYAYLAYQGRLVEIPFLTELMMQKGAFQSVKQLTQGFDE